jgi:outer membrane lipoprotein SlyB
MAARESMASFALWEGCGGASVGSVGGCDCGGLAGQDVEERVTRRGLDDDAVRSDE